MPRKKPVKLIEIIQMAGPNPLRHRTTVRKGDAELIAAYIAYLEGKHNESGAKKSARQWGFSP